MKARAQSADEPGDGRIVPITPPAENGKRAPIYPEWSGEAIDPSDPEVVRRGASLVQWLLLFAVLGGVIGGAKWYTGAGAETDRPPRSGIVITGRAAAATPAGVAGTGGAETTAESATTVSNPGSDGLPAAATEPNGASVASDVRIESLPPTTVVAAATLAGNGAGGDVVPTRAARIVRAPADVPYPRRLREVQPTIPDDAAVQRGVAVLSLLIDVAGNVVEIDVLRGIDAYVDPSVLAAVRQWKFEPTAREGEPVAVRGNFTVKLGY